MKRSFYRCLPRRDGIERLRAAPPNRLLCLSQLLIAETRSMSPLPRKRRSAGRPPEVARRDYSETTPLPPTSLLRRALPTRRHQQPRAAEHFNIAPPMPSQAATVCRWQARPWTTQFAGTSASVDSLPADSAGADVEFSCLSAATMKGMWMDITNQ
jgi:hypothetical protein